MWDEVGSCLLEHFSHYNIKGTKLIAISDNCEGQNKNWSLVSVWLQGTFKKILYKFPQVRHTMLSDFACVEKYVRAQLPIYLHKNIELILQIFNDKNIRFILQYMYIYP